MPQCQLCVALRGIADGLTRIQAPSMMQGDAGIFLGHCSTFSAILVCLTVFLAAFGHLWSFCHFLPLFAFFIFEPLLVIFGQLWSISVILRPFLAIFDFKLLLPTFGHFSPFSLPLGHFFFCHFPVILAFLSSSARFFGSFFGHSDHFRPLFTHHHHCHCSFIFAFSIHFFQLPLSLDPPARFCAGLIMDLTAAV